MKENFKRNKQRSVENLRSKYEYEFADEYNPYSTYGSPSVNQYKQKNRANANNANKSLARSNANYNAEFSRENKNQFSRRKENDGTSSRG